MQIYPDSIVNRSREILFSKLDDELLALDAQAGYYYALNETAGLVWEMIAEPMPVNAVCMHLCQQFAVAPEVCAQEVLKLLQGLHDAGLVQVIR